jgi:hypothetical protein
MLHRVLLMQKTYLQITAITLIGLLAVGTIVAGAAERPRSVPDITRKPRFEMRVPPFQGQVCQIDSKNCTELSRPPPRVCLLSPQSCGVGRTRFVPL